MNAPHSTQNQAPATGGVRFAPSPTGRFHIGNLRTAWISQEWARGLGVPWAVRVEDIDRPRVVPGAQEQQLADLAALGLKPDILIIQSELRARHWALFIEAIRNGQIYPCDCSRKDVQTALAGLASAPHEHPPVYSGHCRLRLDRELRAAESLAWRFRMSDESGCDDFIIARTGVELDREGQPNEASFVPAYHWACAIDDFDGRYQLLVRSHDLWPAARLQHAIQAWLGSMGASEPAPPFLTPVFHTALVTQNDGHRLEKRTQGVTLPELAGSGRSAAWLLERFARSFDRSSIHGPLAPGAMLGETQMSLTLRELGL
jgi:glutamyl-tRNA synthetase